MSQKRKWSPKVVPECLSLLSNSLGYDSSLMSEWVSEWTTKLVGVCSSDHCIATNSSIRGLFKFIVFSLHPVRLDLGQTSPRCQTWVEERNVEPVRRLSTMRRKFSAMEGVSTRPASTAVSWGSIIGGDEDSAPQEILRFTFNQRYCCQCFSGCTLAVGSRARETS